MALYATAALILGFIPVNSDFQPTPGGTAIAVCSNGVHTDFVLPVRAGGIDWTRRFPPSDFGVPVEGFDHVGIGWGDLDFYRSTPHWRDFKLGIALRAVLGFGPSAVHVQYRAGPGPTEDCKTVAVDDAQLQALAGYIDESLQSSAAGEGAILAAPGYGASDRFYRTVGRFSFVWDCNAWVGAGLKAAGLPSGVWTPFSFLVLRHL